MERYESLGLVGEGSYGTVLKCRHRESGRMVAIKKFLDSDDDKTVKKIALREIRLLRQLRHDNLVNLLEVWKRRRRWYLVFEFVERTLLDDLEQNPNGLDLNTSRHYLYQILRAAAFCHQHNVIHRDIKPENILISQGGVVKLCDFGFARTMASPAEGGVYTDYVATRWYRAPELLVGDTTYGKPVDVWAVGCLLLEVFTGQPLFPGDSDLDQIYHIVRCFGNLTAHHQEMFHRNPVFSGVRLPECSGRITLEQRFPTTTADALDLAQSCLQMDPEKRAQCSDLLEHHLFTQDSFHIRVLDELNAKIQKDHRENSTLPKIAKTPKREREEGDEKNRRGKDKKPTEAAEEKLNRGRREKESSEEKMVKPKAKQLAKASKSNRNASEPVTSTRQTKAVGVKVQDNAGKTNVVVKSKPGKATGNPEGSQKTLSNVSTEETITPGTKPGRTTENQDLKPSKTTSNSGPKRIRNASLSTGPSKTSDLSSTTPSPKTETMFVLNKPSKGLQPDGELAKTTKNQEDSGGTSNRDLEEDQDGLKKSSGVLTEISGTSRGDYDEIPGSSDTCKSSTATGSRSMLYLGSKSPKVERGSSFRKNESSSDASRPSRPPQSRSLMGDKEKTKPGPTSFLILKTLRTTEGRKKRETTERSDTFNLSTTSESTSETPDPKTTTRSFVFHNMDPQDAQDSSGPGSSPPPPPPPPSSTPLVPSFPAAGGHLNPGPGLHHGPHNPRCLDKPRHQGGVGTRRKSEVHFPDLRTSTLPELRGREAKHNRSSKDQRKDKQARSSPGPEPGPGPGPEPRPEPGPGPNSTNTHTQ